MFFRVPGQHQGKRAVTGHIACGSKAVLQGEDREHQGSACVVEQKNARDQSQGCHNCSSGDARRADGKDAEEQTEQNHSSDGRNAAVENLGYGHDEENLCQDRAAQMNIGKQRYAEAYHILPENRGLLCTAEGNGQGCGRGHGSHCRKVGRPVVPDNLNRVFAGVDTCQEIQKRHPDIVSCHNDNNDL